MKTILMLTASIPLIIVIAVAWSIQVGVLYMHEELLAGQ